MKANGDENALLPKKRGPKNQTSRMPKEIERTIIKIYRRLGWNATQIWLQIGEKYINSKTGKLYSKPTYYSVLKRYPDYKKEEKEVSIRYEKENPGELGHMDLKKTKNIKGKDPKKKKYFSQLMDDCTRITYVEILPNKKAKTLATFLARATKWFREKHGITFIAILTDNGKEYTWHSERGRKKHSFEKMMIKLRIKHKYTRIRRPQTNGKAERFWRIITDEFAKKYEFISWKDFNLRMHK